jgi:GNAT superfamily N-acetyltransferase
METHLRLGTVADAGIVANHRALMFQEMGLLRVENLPAFERAAMPVIEAAMKAGTYRHWFVEMPGGAVVAGGGVQLRPVLPRPDTGGPEAVILNVFVRPAQRRRGHARRIMGAILDWCRSEKIDRIVLHPSEAGRSLYESMGFQPTGELRLRHS